MFNVTISLATVIMLLSLGGIGAHLHLHNRHDDRITLGFAVACMAMFSQHPIYDLLTSFEFAAVMCLSVAVIYLGIRIGIEVFVPERYPPRQITARRTGYNTFRAQVVAA